MLHTQTRVCRVVAAPVAIVSLMTGCSLQHPAQEENSSTGTSSGTTQTQPPPPCPDDIAALIDSSTVPQREIDLSVDKSKSFIGSAVAVRRIRAQIGAAVGRAVDSGAAFRVSVFVGSVATVQDAVVCPTLAARFNNAAAEKGRKKHLKEVAIKAVWEQVRSTQPRKGGHGSSIVGAWAAMASAQPLAGQREAIMLSDGRGSLEDIAVNLSGFTSVGMYSIGRVADDAPDTASTTQLVETWRTWLTGRGAPGQLVVTSGELQ